MAIELADKSDIPEGKGIVVKTPDGTEIALFNIEGHICGLNNTCPHMGGPLGEGDLEGCLVTCPWHGWQFDVKTGSCENMPGEDIKPLPLRIEGSKVLLEEPEAD